MGSGGCTSSKVSYNIPIEEQEGGKWVAVSKKNGMYVYEMTDPKPALKPPEHSKFPNRVVVMYHKPTDKSYGIKSVTHYDANGDRDFEIHTIGHKGIKPHFHLCSEKNKFSEPFAMTKEKQELLDKAINF